MATAPDHSVSYCKLQDHFATLEAKCQAEETALQAATLRDRAFLHEFDERALRIRQELRAVQRDAEEFIFHMDCKQSLGEHNQRLPIRRRVESIVVRTWPTQSFTCTDPVGRRRQQREPTSTRGGSAPLTPRMPGDALGSWMGNR